MKRILIPSLALSIALASAFFVATSRAAHHEHAESSHAEAMMKPKLVGVLHHADWCGTCKKLDPKLKAIKSDFMDKGVLFTQVDLTDEFTQQQSVLFAAWVGIDKVLAENQKTGFMLLIDPKTNEVVGKLTADQTEDQLSAAISEALESASSG